MVKMFLEGPLAKCRANETASGKKNWFLQFLQEGEYRDSFIDVTDWHFISDSQYKKGQHVRIQVNMRIKNGVVNYSHDEKMDEKPDEIKAVKV